MKIVVTLSNSDDEGDGVSGSDGLLLGSSEGKADPEGCREGRLDGTLLGTLDGIDDPDGAGFS